MDNIEQNTKKEHFINDIKVSEENAKAMLNKPTYFPSDVENIELYNDFVNRQKTAFKIIMNYFRDILIDLRDKGKISDFTDFRARIKSPASALKNDEINNIKLRTNNEEIKNKALDDVFGMEFIGESEEKVKIILDAISNKTIVVKKNDLEKTNGYKAQHRIFSLNKDTLNELSKKYNLDPNDFPLFEAQFKTIAVSLEAYDGDASHADYKKADPKVIQQKYDNNEFKIGYNIPLMWVSKSGKMVLLSSDETLQKMYPFLDISKKKKQHKSEEILESP